MNDRIKRILHPIVLVSLYLAFLFSSLLLEHSNDLLIPINAVDMSNIGIKLGFDFVNGILIIIVIIGLSLIKKKPLGKLGITKNNLILVAILSVLYIVIFFIHGNYTVNGIYIAFFYLIVVALSEELVFRGYLFLSIEREFCFRVSVIISGALWGIPHALIPIIVYNNEPLVAIASEIGGAIVMGAVFAATLKKAKAFLYLC